MSETLNLLRKALENDEFDKFLKGQDNYRVQPHEMVPADVPTDWTIIMSEGVYKFYAANPSAGLDRMFENALIKMTDDIQGLYASLSLFYLQLIRERDGRAPFVIRKEAIVKKLKEKLISHKAQLMKEYRWMGKNKPGGLWDEVKRICVLLEEKFSIRLA